MPHDFLSSYSIKATEYLIALSFLILFPLFWRFVNGGRAAAVVRAAAPAREPAPALAGFAVPEAVWLHAGHAWAQLFDSRARVGLDDFARQLIGPAAEVDLPAVGAAVAQGEPLWRVRVGGKSFEMLSPLDGQVVALNPSRRATPEAGAYGEGWLLELEPTRRAANLKQLMSGEAARRHLSHAVEQLAQASSAPLQLAADGGSPVEGLLAVLDQERFDGVVREHFLSGGGR